MKFFCTQQSLLKALNTCSKAVSTRTTIPILKGILITVKDSRATFVTSDLNMSIETSFDVQNSIDGSTVVSAKLFSDIIRKLPNSLVSVDTDVEPGKLTINCIGSTASIVTLPAEEFPLIGGVNSKEFIELNKKDLKDIISKTIFSASIDEKKGLFTGCLFNLSNNEIEAAALDGFRLAVVKKETEVGKEKKVIIPASILGEIYKILNEDDGSETVSVLFEDKKAEFLTEDTRVIARILEGDFVKYNDIIPKNLTTTVYVNRIDVLDAIERASLFAKEGKNNLIKLTITANGLLIESKSEEGMVNESVNAEVTGDSFVIGFNSKYILDALKVVSDEEVKFELGSSLSPCLIKPTDGDEFTYLILPVRISEE